MRWYLYSHCYHSRDQSPEEFLKLLEERDLVLISTGAGFGQLRDDPEGVAERVKKLGIKYMFIEDESSDPLYQVPESIKYLKNLMY